MLSRWRTVVLLWLALTLALAEETPPGLVSKDSDQDLVAEATHSGSQAQKREAALSNSYGEPIPADSYGPPKDLQNIISDLQHPAPIYEVPELPALQEPPPGAYGPPAPVLFPSQAYHGPPPPISRPKPLFSPQKIYGPPKPIYGPPKPKPIYGPPKKTYGPPKQGLPKPIYGVPFKPQKIIKPKPVYGVPKPVYGPPKVTYGTPLTPVSPPLQVPLPELSGPISVPVQFPLPDLPELQVPPVTNVNLGFNIPAPIYGTPLVTLPIDLKPNFPVPVENYGPPGEVLPPLGPNDSLVFENLGSIGHYGPPQPDPNPQPPHPGIPAPPTPPHVLYDGWKPIPGVSKPIQELHISLDQGLPNLHHHQFSSQNLEQNLANINQHQSASLEQSLANQFNLEQSLPNINQHQFNSAHVSTGYSNIHHDALANIDLNAIVGGDSNHIDQSKTVYEAHYTENNLGNGGKLSDSYGAPPLESLSNGPYPPSVRQQGAKGLIPPSGVYGVPPGSQYGAPPKINPNLPIPYGQYSGGGHAGGHNPHKPIKFRESVPEGVFESIAHTTHSKDSHNYDHLTQGLQYLPPPIRDVKETANTGNAGLNSVSLSIEPTNLYSLPHAGNPISFQQPSNLYGSPIDSYAAPLLTVGVGDHVTSGSYTNSITSTIDGTVLANLSSLDAAAILKHCPYHEAIIKAARFGEKIPVDLASNYVASLSSLGTTLNKGNVISDSYAKDLAGSHSVIHTVYPENQIKNERPESYSLQKGKSLTEKQVTKDERLQFVSDQITKTSERIRSLSEEAKQLQEKIVSSNQNLRVEPDQGKSGYSVEIQSSNDQKGKVNSPAIPHEQLLSEGLLQSILQAIEDPSSSKQSTLAKQYQTQNVITQNQYTQTNQNFANQHSNQFTQTFNYPSEIDLGTSNEGLDLPIGYEPIDRTKTDGSNIKNVLHHDLTHNHSSCDLKTEESIKTEVVVPPPKVNNVKSTDIDPNEVAVFFDKSDETVTEISVATSISEGLESKRKFGEKITS